MPSTDVLMFMSKSTMPDGDVLHIEDDDPGFLDEEIAGARANVYSRLRKRYDVTQFATNGEPAQVKRWIVDLVTPRAYLHRGFNPTDPTMERLFAIAEKTMEEIKEAADARDGLFDLPLLSAGDATAISKGGPLAYSEPSPYDYLDVQREARRGR